VIVDNEPFEAAQTCDVRKRRFSEEVEAPSNRSLELLSEARRVMGENYFALDVVTPRSQSQLAPNQYDARGG
jgi:hypothetical protein